MNSDTIRRNLADILTAATIGGPGILGLVDQCHLAEDTLRLALAHGIADAADLVAICRALDLDAAAVLADACNHSLEGNAPSLPHGAPQPQPETYPS